MGVVKATEKKRSATPSTFALLVDDINKMSESRQKLLWLQIHEEEVSSLAKEMDAAVKPHNLSASEIDSLIKEARNHGSSKKKG
jgi:hypothetical protein